MYLRAPQRMLLSVTLCVAMNYPRRAIIWYLLIFHHRKLKSLKVLQVKVSYKLYNFPLTSTFLRLFLTFKGHGGARGGIYLGAIELCSLV